MKVFYISVAGAFMTACGHVAVPLDKPMKPLREVAIAVPVSCVPKDTPPPPSAYADDGVAKLPDPVARTLARGSANQQRKARLAILEPIVQGCR